MATARPRYQPRPQRVTGWYIVDTRTGAPVQTGLTRPGALQLADRLNRRNPA